MLIDPLGHSLGRQLWSLREQRNSLVPSIVHSKSASQIVYSLLHMVDHMSFDHVTFLTFPYLLLVTMPCVPCIIETMMSFTRQNTSTLYSFYNST